MSENTEKKKGNFFTSFNNIFNKWGAAGAVLLTIITLASIFGGYEVFKYRMIELEKRQDKVEENLSELNFSSLLSDLDKISNKLELQNKQLDKLEVQTTKTNERVDESYELIIELIKK